jgi:hypothetical protein
MSDLLSLMKSEIGSYSRTSHTTTFSDQEITLYSKPLSPADLTRVITKYPGFMHNNEPAGMVMLIVMKAELEDGTKAFNSAHALFLNQMDASKIGAIFGGLFSEQLTEDFDTKVAESEKN